ncbi:MAG: cysteine synthase A [Alphaproteobacteria bacterium]|nr:cysteine synthase A [Alphaproteobacteria bacterium]
MQKIYNSITEMVGDTPLIRLNRLAEKYNVKANILGKCEFYNPLFSVKDRIAARMIESAEKSGRITEDTVFVEATSGNTGIALSALCASKGYKLVILMPENMSVERIEMMKHFGAEVVLTPQGEGMNGAIKKAELLAAKNPNVILTQQFENEANPEAHKLGTAIELIEQTDGNIDCFISAVGTAGTINGVASTLKTYNPDLYVVAVEPAGSPVLNGGLKGPHKIPGIGAGFIPKFYEKDLVNEVVDITDEEAWEMVGITAKAEGLPIGISGGAALAAALKVGAREDMQGKNIVVILASAVERYLSLLFT